MISTKGRYALRVMLDLAEHGNKGYIHLKDIAKRQNISRSGVFQNRHNSLELMKKILKEK